jgi:murein tripeptide amidase MpaA
VSYLNITEVESGLQGLASSYPNLAERIELPNKSVEGRTCHALRIGAHPQADTVLFTGCQHAREWGGAEICLYFAADLLEAYTNGTGLAYGGTFFNAWTIRSIVEYLNVIVFPCVNPDGRKYDQENDALWRKNRNPKDSGGVPWKVGVDLNRNNAWLWDFRTAFNPGALVFGTLASDDPADELYHGSAPDSEPETRNIHWLLDQYRFTRWYLDIHSFTGDVLFPWGDDSDQTSNASMNFMNPAYNGQRGVDGGYQEFIPASDLTTVQGAAQRVTDAINGVRGGHYEAKQSVYLLGTTGAIRYPTSGTIDDYTYSRHFADCTRGKVFGLTVEFGYWTGDYRTSFHPPWTEMEQIVPEIDAGMVELCRIAAPAWVPPWKLLWRRLWPWQIWDPMIRLFEPLVRPLLVRVLGPRGAAG